MAHNIIPIVYRYEHEHDLKKSFSIVNIHLSRTIAAKLSKCARGAQILIVRGSIFGDF